MWQINSVIYYQQVYIILNIVLFIYVYNSKIVNAYVYIV